MLRSTLILGVMLFGLAAGSIVIDPVDPILRVGQTAKMLCKAPSSIRGCLWMINYQLYDPLNPFNDIRSFGNYEDGECGIEFESITDGENGAWECLVFPSFDPAEDEIATTNVTTLVLPKIQLEKITNNKLTVIAGKVTELTCTVADARPEPAVLWKIGEREISSEGIEEATTRSTTVNDGLVTIVDTLRYAFAPSDHGQLVRCITAGSWIVVGQDEYQASALLDVMFAPQPQDPITQHGFVDGQPADIVVNFTANPQPTQVWWILENQDKIDVPTQGDSYHTVAYEVYPINGSQGTYEARLRLKTITEESAAMVYRLSVGSFLQGQLQLQEYTVHISMNAAPLPSADLNRGSIAAIIIVMIVLLVIVAVTMYARNTGRWCFAGQGESQARIDQENPAEIVKEKEGNEAPLKGSTENLNLSLPTNGQTDTSSSPVKEQQQNDDKDTAV